MYDFRRFALAINDRFTQLVQCGELYVTNIEKDDLYDYYLNAFPDGTNPIYRTRREYDCSTCKSFIRNIGNVVAIHEGALISVWDVEGLAYPYDVVAKAMSEYVKSAGTATDPGEGKPIASIFRVKEGAYGAAVTRELLGDGGLVVWHHFHGKIAPRYLSSSPGQAMGDADSTMQVMRRGLTELSMDAIETVIELVTSKAVYRGEEHLPALIGFKALMEQYNAAPNKELFLWSNLSNRAARLRNSAIGTLVQAISEGEDTTEAVHSFGSKMEGYKRPKNPIYTESMGKAALKTIQDLGIESSLSRRHAHIADLNVNDVLWVDNAVRGMMKDSTDGISSLIMSQAKGKPPTLDNATPIAIEEFMATVLPKASSIDMLFENRHVGNLVSITTTTDPDAPGIFKWGGRGKNFAWSYKDNNADSIKQRVKAAGGNVSAPFRVSLAWYNYDDLDLHVIEPNGNEVYYGNKCGKLDVDQNVSQPVRNAVENVCWTRPLDGKYRVRVHQYSKRESIDVGFTLEVENHGDISTYHYPLPVHSYVDSLTITVKGGRVTDIVPGSKMEGGNSSKDEWGLKTQSLVKVHTITFSPNYWSENVVGNKHWFFILHGCRCPEPIRGFFNEYLSPALDKHRKVFEVLGDQTKVQPADEQLSGLGFSSTKQDKVKVLVTAGTNTRAYEINF
jgi:subtilisin-like proprotein convertase family protein